MDTKRYPALLWDRLADNYVKCRLCRFACQIAPGQRGRCQVRENVAGELFSLTYHALCSAQADPVEKKPLFHYRPGERTFSIATMGCNFQCDFCQNWQISQAPRQSEGLRGEAADPEQIVQAGQRQRCTSLAYTYTEPTIFFELAQACGLLARARGLGNIFVSNGYMSDETLELMTGFVDAINVDLKSFRAAFYRDCCKASLAGVLESLRYLAQKTDIWLEVTTLVVPGLNDGEEELKDIALFMVNELGDQVPWHISRFYPQYERRELPATPADTLMRAYDIGKQAGLRYVYVGNLPGGGRENTYCHKCGQLLIERRGYQLGQIHLSGGHCPQCQTLLAGESLTAIGQ